MECLTINSIRSFVGVQWNLELKDILPGLLPESCLYSSDEESSKIPEKILCSVQRKIKGIESLNFSLELTDDLNLLVKSHSGWPYEIIYAFAVVKDRAFWVKNNDKLKYLDILEMHQLYSVEEVTFYCMILIGQPVEDPTAANKDLTNNNEVSSTGRQVGVDAEDTEHLQSKFNGEIPEFDVDKAKESITDESTDSVSKILAVEYLMKNIKASNVSDILTIAVNQDLKALMKKCSEFLSDCIIESRQVDSPSSTIASSDDD